MNHAAADARGASMRTSKSQLTIRVSGTAFHSDTYKGSQINTAPDISFGRADVPNPLEERVEVRDVEVDHFAKGSGLVLEIHLEPQLGGPQSILERTGVVGPTIDEAELREALKELRRGRDVNVKGPRDLARKVPLPVAEGPEDRDAVLAGEEENGLSEGLLVHRGVPRNQARPEGRSLFVVELGALKGCPGILNLDYLGEERTNSGRSRGPRPV